MGLINNKIVQTVCLGLVDATRNGNKIFYREKTLRIKRAGEDKRIFLLNTPEYGNLGDHLIAMGELIFLYDFFSSLPIYEITQTHLLMDWKGVKEIITDQDLVLVTGGGFMGSLWLYSEEIVQKIASSFQCPIVILPQTAYYSEDAQGRELYIKAKHIYSSNDKLYAIARDNMTHTIFTEFVGKQRSELLPDMALYAAKKLLVNNNQRNSVKMCFRKDKEVLLKKEIKDKIVQALVKLDLDFEYFDTVLDDNVLFCDRRIYKLQKMVDFLGETSLIITDRLHGMIFSIITNTPCIAFDNVSRKVSGVFDVISKRTSVNNVVLIDINDVNNIDYLSIIERLLNSDIEQNIVDLHKVYKPLAEIIGDLI